MTPHHLESTAFIDPRETCSPSSMTTRASLRAHERVVLDDGRRPYVCGGGRRKGTGRGLGWLFGGPIRSMVRRSDAHGGREAVFPARGCRLGKRAV